MANSNWAKVKCNELVKQVTELLAVEWFNEHKCALGFVERDVVVLTLQDWTDEILNGK